MSCKAYSTYEYIYIYIYRCMHAWMYGCMDVCMYVCVCICICVYVDVAVDVVYVYMYMFMYMYMYMFMFLYGRALWVLPLPPLPHSPPPKKKSIPDKYIQGPGALSTSHVRRGAPVPQRGGGGALNSEAQDPSHSRADHWKKA